MKKLTLDETWKRCLSMWRWIVKRRRAGSCLSVNTLKAQWLKAHDPYTNLLSDCYFCQWFRVHTKAVRRLPGTLGGCLGCPGQKVDSHFACETPEYDYRYQPVAFLCKLEQLNRKRKGGK